MLHSLIIIRGPLGVGKTTISKILSERMGAKYFSIDGFLEKTKLDKIDPKEKRIPLANFLAAEEEMMPEINKTLERFDVIVDGSFYYKEQVVFFRQNVGRNFLVVTLKAKLETCIARDKKREKPYGKKIVQDVYNLVSALDTGLVIDVDGKKREQIVELIQKELNALIR